MSGHNPVTMGGHVIRKAILLTVLLFGVVGVGTALAFDNLQIYIVGATYDTITDTWVVNSPTFQLWVIGDSPVDGVSLTAAYLTGESGTISLTPTTTGGFGGFTDPSTPGAPGSPFFSAPDQVPQLSDGSYLPKHGIYGPGSGHSFEQWSIGDFTSTTESPLGDFQVSFPSPSATQFGQINAYNVAVTGFTQVHFDAFNTVMAGNHGTTLAINAPFSHDAETQVPEPGTMVLLGSGLMGLVGTRFARKK